MREVIKIAKSEIHHRTVHKESDRLVEAVSKMYVCNTNGSCPPFKGQSAPIIKPSEVGFFR